ncbi:MAG: hypothetical protein RSD02_12645 [Niameybacter sp.]
MATNNKNYMRIYQKNRRAGEERESMTDEITSVNFTTDIKPSQLKKAYKGRIETDDQKLLLSNALVIIDLMQSCKKSLEADGAYIKTATGLVKENPAQKSLRENVKALTVLLDTLNKSILANKKGDIFDLEKWLDED